MSNTIKKISIFGMFGAKNVGDEIISFVMNRKIKEKFPDSKIQILSQDPSYSLQFIEDKDVNVMELNLFNRKFWGQVKKNLEIIKKCDVLIVGGGGLFQDQYSFHLPLSTLLVLAVGISNGIPSYVIGTGFGPIKSKKIKNIASRVMENVDYINLRDEKSYEYFNIICRNSNVNLTADVVPSLDEFDFYRNYWNEDSNIISFVLRDWKGIDEKGIGKLIDKLIENNYKIRFHCYEHAPDFDLVNRILSNSKNKTDINIEIINPKSTGDAYAKLVESLVVISMRYHGCILAATLGVPLIPVKYEIKVEELAKQLRIDNDLVETNSLNIDMYSSIVKLESIKKHNRSKYIDNFNVIRTNSNKNFNVFNDKSKNRDVTKLSRLSVISILLYGFIEYIQYFVKSRSSR